MTGLLSQGQTHVFSQAADSGCEETVGTDSAMAVPRFEQAAKGSTSSSWTVVAANAGLRRSLGSSGPVLSDLHLPDAADLAARQAARAASPLDASGDNHQLRLTRFGHHAGVSRPMTISQALVVGTGRQAPAEGQGAPGCLRKKTGR